MIPFGELMVMTPKEYYTDEKDLRLAGHGYKRKSQFTKEQQRTFITIRSLAASPLFMGGVLITMDEYSKKILLNKEMLACDQNGVMGLKVSAKDNIETWITPNKEIPGRGWLGIFNRNEKDVQVSVSLADLALSESKEYDMYNIWEDKKFKFGSERKTFNISQDDVVFLKFEELKEA